MFYKHPDTGFFREEIKMQKKTVLWVAVFALLVFSNGLTAERETGDITVVADAIGAGKNDALLRAKRNAVMNGIGHVVISETEVSQFILQKDKIITQTMGAVKTYRVLESKQATDGTYEVKIEAVVSLADISKDLAAMQILLESMDKPRVMILVDEQIGGSRTTNCETALADRLLEYKFNLVDPAMVAALLDRGDDLISRAVAGDKGAAVQIGVANGAEVVIAGRVKTSMADPLYNMKSAQADIAIQAISCAGGNIIASKNVHAAAIQITDAAAQAEAVKKAALKVIENTSDGKVVTSLFDKIVGSWQDTVNNGMVIRVVVENVASFKTCKAVMKTLDALGNDFVSVAQRGWQKPVLNLEVTYKGLPEMLAEAIDGKPVPGMGTLSVTNLMAGSVSVELMP